MTHRPAFPTALQQIAALMLLLLLAGCTGAPTRQATPEAASSAEAAYRDGDFAAAANGFLEAASLRRSQRNYYRLRAAESWRENGELDRAREVLSNAGHKGLSGDQPLRLNLLLAEIDLASGDARAAQDWLRLPPDSVGEAYIGRYLDLRARAFAESDPVIAAAARARLDARLRPDERAANLAEIQTLLDRLDDARLQSAAASLPGGDPLYPFVGRLLMQRGLPLPRAFDRGIEFARDLPPAAADGWRPPYQVALLLPESGSFAVAAGAVRDGFFAAHFSETQRHPEIRVYNSGSSPASSRAAYEQAVRDGAGLVVGPLSRENVAAIFAQGALPTPLLALNRAGELPPPPGSLSFSLSPEDDARAAAERLWTQARQRVIAVGSDDENGRRSLDAFRREFEERGGQVVAQAILPGNSPRYDAVLKQAVSNAGGVTIDPETGIPQANAADALFLAVGTAQARLLVPQLKVQGIQNLPTVATSTILNAPNRRLDRELDGIEVVESPWLVGDLPGFPHRSTIRDELESADGVAARLFAFGIDAYRLVGYLSYLTSTAGAQVDGATGRLSLDGFGNVRRQPVWALLKHGRLQPPVESTGLE
ncbi:MAG: penicillin-binding protein activator [Xanthomonadales bacterium]|nr:penicillin-binding protein activator [Xanthomonadales bacterium]